MKCKLKIFPISFILFIVAECSVFSMEVIPSGEPIGVIIQNDGLVITETTSVTNENGETVNPSKIAGIKAGDVIVAVDNERVNTLDEFSAKISNVSSPIILSIKREAKILEKKITPIKSKDGYRLGLWLRDSIAGIGTITFINPETKEYYSLGHEVTDIDTGLPISIKEGSIHSCSIQSPTKSTVGNPGELNGLFESTTLGNITKNSKFGISGTLNKIPDSKKIEVATICDAQKGNAKIISNVDGLGLKQYDIQIKQILSKNKLGKDMIIEITDQELISKTGGIVQGMSGSPIIQNGKLLGAITHVFVDSPNRGYAIFAENMINN